MIMFHKDEKLENLESQGRIMEAVHDTYSGWLKNQDDINALLRAGTEAWLANVYDCCSDEIVDYDQCDSILTETFQYGEAFFPSQADFLCIFGYMLKLFPYYFNMFDGDYDKWSKHGRDMILKASQLRPTDIFIQAIQSLDSDGGIRLPRDYIPGGSAIEIYFRNILCE